MDVPGKCQWLSSIRLDLDNDDDSEGGPTISVLGYYESEKMAARVFDTAARYQWGDRAATLINFSAKSKNDMVQLQQAMKDVHSWAQCESCNKWRVLKDPWKKKEFRCEMVLRSCKDVEVRNFSSF
jgi:hypothetical protein